MKIELYLVDNYPFFLYIYIYMCVCVLFNVNIISYILGQNVYFALRLTSMQMISSCLLTYKEEEKEREREKEDQKTKVKTNNEP
jgi:hypothetical protein